MNTGLHPALGLAAGLLCVAGQAEAKVKQKYNVIYILADDLGYGDLGCTGQARFATPNIDSLRAGGMLFTQHYSGCAVSAPSRSALLTGQHTGHTYIRGNREMKEGEGQLPLPDHTYTMAEMFRSAGYATACTGKWGLGYPGSEGDPLNQGFDDFYGYNCQLLAHRYYPDHLWHNRDRITLTGNAGYRRGDYAPDMIHEHTLSWLDSRGDDPFFLYYAIVQPHAELIVPEDSIIAAYRGRFEERPYKGGAKGDYGQQMSKGGYCSQPETRATFAAMVARIDKYVGDIMALLREKGLDKNTIVMFTSDNGPHREGGADPDFFNSYGPYRGVKRDLYEGGIRLPLIAWAPGMIEGGSQNDHVCAMWDMLPTFAQIAGAKVPSGAAVDGISILPALTGRGRQRCHDYLYWEFHEMGGRQAVRMGRWKGVATNVMNPAKTRLELFDLETDPGERHDVAADNPDICSRLRGIMRSARTESPQFPFKAIDME